MAASNLAARRVVERSVARAGGRPLRVMVAPLAVTPFSRWVVVETERGYQVGMLEWAPAPRVRLQPLPFWKEPPEPLAAALRRDPTARKFLSWARFPYYVVEARGDGQTVYIGDARYTVDPEASWAAVRIDLPGPAP
jgi:hypothetical protein